MTGTDRSLVPWIDRRIKYQQQESFTWTSPTTPQFNLTKIDHNRLIVRCILRTISYEISVYDHTTDLHELSRSNPVPEWWCHDDVTITSTPESDWMQHRKGQLMTHQRLLSKNSWNGLQSTMQLWNDDWKRPIVNCLSHSSIIYFILNWDNRLLV